MAAPPESPKSSATESGCIWTSIRKTAQQRAACEPMLASFLHATILNHDRFEDAVSYHLAAKLDSNTLCAMQLREVILHAMDSDPGIGRAVCDDIRAVQERDPAINCCLVPLLSISCASSANVYVSQGKQKNRNHQPPDISAFAAQLLQPLKLNRFEK